MENTFVFVPNLIGYARILLAFVSFYFMPKDYVTATCCYVVSALLDEVDGKVARYLNQCSKFGAMLDLLTDCATTMGVMVFLCTLYPSWVFLFQLNMIIDIVGHWMYVCVSSLFGIDSHKDIDSFGNPILRYYYIHPIFLNFLHFGNQIFYVALYLSYFTTGPKVPLVNIGLWKFLCILSAPVAFVKSVISVVHLYVACCSVVALDNSKREKKAQ